MQILDLRMFQPRTLRNQGSVLGVPICRANQTDAEDLIHEVVATSGTLRVHFCNAYTLVCARERADVRQALTAAKSANFADGSPVAWALSSRRSTMRMRIARPVRGPATMESLISAGAEGAVHLFYGGSESTLGALQVAVTKLAQRTVVSHIVSPPFSHTIETHAAELEQLIEVHKPTYVWVGLGTPKQDLVMAACEPKSPCILLAVGAAFDFLAGTKKQAPDWMHGTGLEWLHRLVSEPRRLWKRYLIGNAKFIAYLVVDLSRSAHEWFGSRTERWSVVR